MSHLVTNPSKLFHRSQSCGEMKRGRRETFWASAQRTPQPEYVTRSYNCRFAGVSEGALAKERVRK